MSDFSIQIQNLSKRYRIGLREDMHDTLFDAVTSWLKAPVANFKQLRKLSTFEADEDDAADVIWALKDACLEIKHGEVVGIIGRNGAGKSTLLKIISRITEPTAGRVILNGRVGSLLEVGTGFHPELTGRENVYLNGTILGMSKREIDRKFDEIVDFAGVEQFIDTPVKRYSSGMQVRLAFAVAAHLEPEILLIDEVLAVGDAEFQKKCLNKMEDVGQKGRTILFVSHSMPAVTRLCERTILIEKGAIVQDGPSRGVVAAYLNSGLGTLAVREWPDLTQAPGNEIVRLCAVRGRTEDGKIAEAVDIRQPVGIELEYEVLKPGFALWPALTAHNQEGVFMFSAFDLDPDWRGRPRPTGRYVSTGWIPGNLLAEGTIIIGPSMWTMHPKMRHLFERDTIAFQVVDTVEGNSARGDWGGQMGGVMRPLLTWNTQFNPNGQMETQGLPLRE